jgi:hypothetical protein
MNLLRTLRTWRATIVLAVIAAVAALALARPWENGVTHAEPSKVEPGVTLVFDQKGIDQTAARASLAVGVPVIPPGAKGLGLEVKAIRIDPIPPSREGVAAAPRPVTAIYHEAAIDPRAIPKVPTGLMMQVTFLRGRWETGETIGEDGKAEDTLDTLAFDVPGFTLIRLTSVAAPEQGVRYQLISDYATYMVRIGYEIEGSGKVRPTDAEMMSFLRALAQGRS